MTTFEDLVLQKTITADGLRPAWAGNILAALGHADGWGRVADGGLTREELGILHCLKLRVEGRADKPEDDSIEYAGTRGLLGWVLEIVLDDSRIAEREPKFRELVAALDRALREYHHQAEGAPDVDTP
ncbi:hypothetical protein ACGFJT_41780 [Actinomadura geliboluensis]|uniref:hypothetical protein n=1 Tax=Actinomadura geliboluensis TaxID=882440 RepID=UPI0037246DE9